MREESLNRFGVVIPHWILQVWAEMVYLIVFYIILSASELSKLGARIIRQGNNII